MKPKWLHLTELCPLFPNSLQPLVEDLQEGELLYVRAQCHHLRYPLVVRHGAQQFSEHLLQAVLLYFWHPKRLCDTHPVIHQALQWYFDQRPFSVAFWLPATGELLLSITQEERLNEYHLIYKADLSGFGSQFNPLLALQTPRQPLQIPNKLVQATLVFLWQPAFLLELVRNSRRHMQIRLNQLAAFLWAPSILKQRMPNIYDALKIYFQQLKPA